LEHFIIVLPKAKQDIRHNVDWLQRKYSDQTASRWQSAVTRTMRTLKNNPSRFAFASEANDLSVPLRELIHGKRRIVYRILFTITNNTVYIHRIRNAAQDRLGEDDF